MASVSFRNHNPGNIMTVGGFAARRGAVDDGNGYAQWKQTIQGVAAFFDLLATADYRALTLLDLVKKYAPKDSGNNPTEYAGYVAERAGVSMSTVIGEIVDPWPLLKIAEAMFRFEGWHA